MSKPKCILCDKTIKFSRNCPALNQTICSTCCGTKRKSEIQCVKSCKYFIELEIKENKKEITQLVKKSFNVESEDIYQDNNILQLVGPFEQYVFTNYYNHIDATDEFMSDCYTKIYYSLEEKESIYTFNKIETEIFDKFSKIAEETKMPIESQKLILVRMMKSIENMTGGRFGNRMYLELLRNTFTGTGVVADTMRSSK